VINLRSWIIVSWIALPTVMLGGSSLLRLINRGNILSPFQVNCFRAGHAHAGVLLLMALLYYNFLDQTTLSVSIKHLASALLFAGILAQSGGFFLHMLLGQENRPSAGTRVTIAGAGLLTCCVVVLVYGLLR
jgi:hypothetical protein